MLYPLSYGRWLYCVLLVRRSHGRPTRTLPPVRRGPKLKSVPARENSVTARRRFDHALNPRSGASHRKGPGRHARPGPSWRRRRDLNPRTGCPVTTLAGWRTRPDYATSPCDSFNPVRTMPRGPEYLAHGGLSKAEGSAAPRPAPLRRHPAVFPPARAAFQGGRTALGRPGRRPAAYFT